MARFSRLIKLFTVFLIPTLLSGCGPDLGVFEDENENYYDNFGKVTGLYDGGYHDYDIEESLYNKTTFNDLKWEKSEYEVSIEPYLYIVVPFEAELKIEAIVLFFYTTENVNVEISSFYFENNSVAPQKIKYLSSPDTEIVHDDETDTDVEVEIDYDDPPKEKSLASVNMHFSKEEWYSFTLGDFKQRDYNDGCLHTAENGLLYLRVENNSGFNRDTMTSVNFSFINLLVRAVE